MEEDMDEQLYHKEHQGQSNHSTWSYNSVYIPQTFVKTHWMHTTKYELYYKLHTFGDNVVSM